MRFTLIAITCLALLAGCHGGLENLAKQIPGVKTAKVSWEDKKLVLGIEVGTEVTDEQVHDAIERANFTAGESAK